MRATSSTARPSSGPGLSPCPRASNASAARPPSAHARAKSKWLSLRESAPWRITTPAVAAPRAVAKRAHASPSASPVSTGGWARTVRMAWHHAAPPMATAQTSVSHVWPLGSTLDAHGVLQLGGCDARALAREFGTPAYIVVEDDLRTRARRFLAAFAARTDDFEVHFASKSFPATAVLRLFAQEGLACDVASGGELHLALNAGFDPKKIHLHGNAKSEAELRQALDAGIGDIVVDNLDELDALLRLVPAGRRQRILLRVAPGVSPDTHPKISTGGPNTKFGFNPRDAAIAIERAQASDRLDLDGLHFHIGSQILHPQPVPAPLEGVAPPRAVPAHQKGGGPRPPHTH